MSHPAAVLCLSVSLSLSLSVFLPAAARSETKKPVPAYTNDDLDRVSPLRDQTGGTSAPAVRPAPLPPESKPAGRGEEYWRREADRLRDRIEPLRARARELQLRVEDRRRKPGVRPYSDPQIESWQRQAQDVEERIRDLETRFEDRARREGALPGWLR
jgi:hypothetical protein